MRRATWTLCHPFRSVALNNLSSSSRATTTVPQYRGQRMENPIKTYLQHGHLFKLGSLWTLQSSVLVQQDSPQLKI